MLFYLQGHLTASGTLVEAEPPQAQQQATDAGELLPNEASQVCRMSKKDVKCFMNSFGQNIGISSCFWFVVIYYPDSVLWLEE